MATTQAPAQAPRQDEREYAFQCKHCDALETRDAAGDNSVPGACHVCRHGVRYKAHEDRTDFDKVFEPEKWIILADLSEKQLAADFHRHGLTPAKVVRHPPKEPASPMPAGKTVIATAQETPGSKDKASAAR